MDSQKEKDWSDSVRSYYFIRSFSYRDLLTPVALLLLFFAVRELLFYYGTPFPRNYIFILCGILNHTVYRLEHRRSNNFIGRWLHDLVFAVVFLVFVRLYSLIEGSDNPLAYDTGGVVGLVFFIIVFATLLETAIGVLKLIPFVRRWQVL